MFLVEQRLTVESKGNFFVEQRLTVESKGNSCRAAIDSRVKRQMQRLTVESKRQMKKKVALVANCAEEA
jgi:hypothetical protein